MDELTRERFAPVPLAPRRILDDDLDVIDERRRILCGSEPNVLTTERVRSRRLIAARRTKDARLVKVIVGWKR